MRPVFIPKGRKQQFKKPKVEKTKHFYHKRQPGNNMWHQSRAGRAIENMQETQEVELMDTGIQKKNQQPGNHTCSCVSRMYKMYLLLSKVSTASTSRRRAIGVDAAQHRSHFLPDVSFLPPFNRTLRLTSGAISLFSSPHVLLSASRSDTFLFFSLLPACCSLWGCGPAATEWGRVV